MRYECARCSELARTVENILNELVELTSKQLTAFEHGEIGIFMQLDKQLELTVGKKERSLGAYREHKGEHSFVWDAKAS
jgi:hypothetical protein